MSSLWPFLVAVTVICIAPGPDMAFVMASGLTHGRQGGVLAAVGVSLGVSVWVMSTALGLGALLSAVPAIATALRVAGALYLAHLAWQTWRAAGTHGELVTVGAGSQSRWSRWTTFWRGTLTNLANPKMALFFMAFLPQFVRQGHGSVVVQFLLLGLILQAVGLLVDAVVGLVAGGVRDLIADRPAVRRSLDRAAAAVLGALGLALVYELVRG
ncbi:MAG: LysE family translocator [Frankiaceae bacterium]